VKEVEHTLSEINRSFIGHGGEYIRKISRQQNISNKRQYVQKIKVQWRWSCEKDWAIGWMQWESVKAFLIVVCGKRVDPLVLIMKNNNRLQGCLLHTRSVHSRLGQSFNNFRGGESRSSRMMSGSRLSHKKASLFL
jgi:hypothetical protein